MTNIFYITVLLFAVFFISLIFFGVKAIINSLKYRNVNQFENSNKLIRKILVKDEMLPVYNDELSSLKGRVTKLEIQNAALRHVISINRKSARSHQGRVLYPDNVAKVGFKHLEIKLSPEVDYDYKNSKYDYINRGEYAT